MRELGEFLNVIITLLTNKIQGDRLDLLQFQPSLFLIYSFFYTCQNEEVFVFCSSFFGHACGRLVAAQVLFLTDKNMNK
jgi:hypothetical protein